MDKKIEEFLTKNVDALIAQQSSWWVDWFAVCDIIWIPKTFEVKEAIRSRFKTIKRRDRKEMLLKPRKIDWESLVNSKEEREIQAEVSEDEDMTALEKIMLKLQKKWVNVSINYWWLKTHERNKIEPYHWWNPDNVLVISDLHCPYVLDWYLKFCREQQEKFDCWTVVYIWDIVDFHSISYHEKIPEELNPQWEMARAREILKDWYHTFPTATVTWWNHDSLVWRQARTAWLLREFIQDPNTIFQAPSTYKFVDEIVIDWVLYTHWSSSNAFKKCILEWMNMVSWHAHTQCWVMYHQNRHWQTWWMQVWVWIDYKQQAFEYAKSNSKMPITACWVVLNKGQLPIVLPFNIS